MNACNQHPDTDGTGILQHNPYTMCTDEIRQNANQLRTLHKSNGPPSDRSNNLKLQKVDARSGHGRGVAYGIQQGLWQNGTRGQQNRLEGHECNIRDDTRQDCAYPCSKKMLHLQKPCRQLQTIKRVPSLHPNNSEG